MATALRDLLRSGRPLQTHALGTLPWRISPPPPAVPSQRGLPVAYATAVLGVSPDILVHEVGELGEVLGVAMPTWSSISCSISGGATAEDSKRTRG